MYSVSSAKMTDTEVNEGSRNGCKRPPDDKIIEESKESVCKVARVDEPADASECQDSTGDGKRSSEPGQAPSASGESHHDSHSDSDDEMEKDKSGLLVGTTLGDL